MIEKLTTPEELSGVFNWSLEGLRRLLKNKDFTKTMTVEETRQYYQRLVSPLSAFIQDCIEITYKEEDFITKDEFYDAFVDYCKEKKIVAPRKENVGRFMKKAAPKIKTRHPKIGDKQEYAWTGCTFRLTEE